MSDYSRTRSMPVPADVFDYLADVHHLPEYFPMITAAEPAGGDAVDTTAVIAPPGQDKRTVRGEAWFKADGSAKKLTWGSEGDNDYYGEISVAADAGGSTVTFSMHTEADHPGIDDSIDDTLERIADLSGKGVPQKE